LLSQVGLLVLVLRKLFQNMACSAILQQADVLTYVSAGFRHPSDSVRELAAFVTRRLLVNAPPSYMSTYITASVDAASGVVDAVVAAVLAVDGMVNGIAMCVGDARIAVAEVRMCVRHWRRFRNTTSISECPLRCYHHRCRAAGSERARSSSYLQPLLSTSSLPAPVSSLD
jgi:hypothetical protein